MPPLRLLSLLCGHFAACNVRSGSLGDIAGRRYNVRFTPENGRALRAPKAETRHRAARRIFRKIEITAKRQGADRGLLRRRPVLADQFHEPIMVLRHVGSIRQAVEYLQDRVVIFRRARL